MVEECFSCGESGEKLKLFDAISKEGIVKICKECASKENIPILKKQSKIFISQTPYSNLNNKEETVYERLSRISGFDFKNKKSEEEKELLKKQETTLRNIVDKNFYKENLIESKFRLDLIKNFHWIIMKARRAKHLTQEQLAKEIAESKEAINMIEKAILPENSHKLIEKLENFLKIKISKKEFAEKTEDKPKEISFDPITTKNLTIADLQEMKRKKEEKILGEPANSEETQEKEAEEDFF